MKKDHLNFLSHIAFLSKDSQSRARERKIFFHYILQPDAQPCQQSRKEAPGLGWNSWLSLGFLFLIVKSLLIFQSTLNISRFILIFRKINIKVYTFPQQKSFSKIAASKRWSIISLWVCMKPTLAVKHCGQGR